MGKIKFKKPDIKGCFGKLKSLKWADMKNGIRAMKKRQAEKEAAYRNSRFAQKMQKLYPYMNLLFTDFARHLGNLPSTF